MHGEGSRSPGTGLFRREKYGISKAGRLDTMGAQRGPEGSDKYLLEVMVVLLIVRHDGERMEEKESLRESIWRWRKRKREKRLDEFLGR